MTQSVPMEPFGGREDVVEDLARQSREFLGKSREYLAAGDLHQASEKGWGVAAWMAEDQVGYFARLQLKGRTPSP